MTKTFQSAYEKLKAFLSDSLTAENTDKVTSLSSELEVMKNEMDKEEKDHRETKNKLVDYVKSTSFKQDSTKVDPIDDEPKTFAEAQKIAMDKLMENRKKENKN